MYVCIKNGMLLLLIYFDINTYSNTTSIISHLLYYYHKVTLKIKDNYIHTICSVYYMVSYFGRNEWSNTNNVLIHKYRINMSKRHNRCLHMGEVFKQ